MTAPESSPAGSDPFPPTRWTLVRKASADPASGGRALEELCQQYWRPVYVVIRSRVAAREDAEDLTQEYFASFLRRAYYKAADPDRGKFRAYLMTDLRLFLSSNHARQSAAKRGGGREIVSLDALELEKRLAGREDIAAAAPEVIFDREWALELGRQALEALRARHEKTGNAELFDLLKTGLQREVTEPEYEAWARTLDSKPENIRMAVSRLRQKLRQTLRQLVRETVSSEADFEDEMRHLRAVLRQESADRGLGG
jgi:RNA polymerase sigma factor (sigma-70 family)